MATVHMRAMAMPTPTIEKPLVFSCSGCSPAAQLANRLAVTLDRHQHMQMSCIAGIGGRVKAILKLARSGRAIFVIDGCPLQCAQASLQLADITADAHLNLADMGIKKNPADDYDQAQVDTLEQWILEQYSTRLIAKQSA